ncbi:hypothetical protein EVAR_95854_1 [Eumeta japonica]|uniref:Uncharacterized protein n=1 Tax=Eumeta variegata TaxID=151549 RepID=A0A4C1VLV0_EUMVA|nr:hypothetical protein EVAR_95854_1 [Eumeta japonica]
MQSSPRFRDSWMKPPTGARDVAGAKCNHVWSGRPHPYAAKGAADNVKPTSDMQSSPSTVVTGTAMWSRRSHSCAAEEAATNVELSSYGQSPSSTVATGTTTWYRRSHPCAVEEAATSVKLSSDGPEPPGPAPADGYSPVEPKSKSGVKLESVLKRARNMGEKRDWNHDGHGVIDRYKKCRKSFYVQKTGAAG